MPTTKRNMLTRVSVWGTGDGWDVGNGRGGTKPKNSDRI